MIRLLLEHEVDLVFVRHRPNFFARVVRGDQNFITDLWRKQISMNEDEKRSIAQEIVDCSIYNKIRLLQSLAKNRSIDFKPEINRLNQNRNACPSATTRETLMGLEGDATKTYYTALKKIIP